MLKLNKFTCLLLSAAFTMSALPSIAQAKAPVPLDFWAVRDSVRSVSVSPDGKHLVFMRIDSKEGNPKLVIYKTDDLSSPLRVLDAKPMEFGSIRWVSDNILVGTASKVVKSKVKRPEDDVRKYKFFSYNLEKNKFAEASGTFSIVNNLPNDPDNVLVQSTRAIPNTQGVDPGAAFRPRSYYKFNLKTGRNSLVLKGHERIPRASFDNDGNPVYAVSVDPNSKEIIYHYRLPGEKKWHEYADRLDGKSQEELYRQISGIHGFVGTKQDDPTIAYVIDAHHGSDKTALWEFDLKTGKYGKKLYENPNADVTGVLWHSNYWGGNQKLVAANYSGAKREHHWFDMQEKALYEQFERKIPNGYQISITSRSRNGKTMIVYNRGPKDPGSYWLVQDGKMAFLASRNPLVKPEDLSNVEYVRYTARDGLTIPAYLTKPKGVGPFPTIILPHGGPHINEVIIYDEWTQYLANNGYMVLQPQYRISTGWGKKHFDAGYGEHGFKMQDDKDDGAQYLIDKGLADPDRIAMYGYSYGGYAAHVAASRTPQLYQCAISGAAVGDARKRYLQRKNDFFPAGDEWAKRRGAYDAIDPIKEIPKLNIPQLLIHGTVDYRVEYFNATDYMKAAKKAGKGHLVKLLTLKGAGHTISTHYYKHNIAYYTEILRYLKEDCGPGGL